MDETETGARSPAENPSAQWQSASLEEKGELIEGDVRRLLRELAESRRRLAEESQRGLKSKKTLLLEMLAVLDAFDRVFDNVEKRPAEVTPQTKIWLGNFRAVRRLLEKCVTEQGAVRMTHLDSGFDPQWHIVAETMMDPSRANGDILEEVRPGYFLGEEVLRKAEVTVVNNDE